MSLNKDTLQKRINVSNSKNMPLEIEIFLIQKYLDDIEKLSKTIGSYSEEWLNQALKKNSNQLLQRSLTIKQ